VRFVLIDRVDRSPVDLSDSRLTNLMNANLMVGIGLALDLLAGFPYFYL
jgi:hypothetical protein